MKRVLIALILMVSAGLAAAGGLLYSSIKYSRICTLGWQFLCRSGGKVWGSSRPLCTDKRPV